jgi:hypothetical protein
MPAWSNRKGIAGRDAFRIRWQRTWYLGRGVACHFSAQWIWSSWYNIQSTSLPDFTPLLFIQAGASEDGASLGMPGGKSLGTSEGESVGVSTLDAFRAGEATGTISVSITFSFDFLAPFAGARVAAIGELLFCFSVRKDFRFQMLGWENL